MPRIGIFLAVLILGGCAQPAERTAPSVATPSPTAAAPESISPTLTPSPTATREEEYHDLLRRGMDECMAKRYSSALAFLTRAEALEPDDPKLILWLFVAHKNTEYRHAPDSKAYYYAQKLVDYYGKSPRAQSAAEFIELVDSGMIEDLEDRLRALGYKRLGKFRGRSLTLLGESKADRIFGEGELEMGMIELDFGDRLQYPTLILAGQVLNLSVAEWKLFLKTFSALSERTGVPVEDTFTVFRKFTTAHSDGEGAAVGLGLAQDPEGLAAIFLFTAGGGFTQGLVLDRSTAQNLAKLFAAVDKDLRPPPPPRPKPAPTMSGGLESEYSRGFDVGYSGGSMQRLVPTWVYEAYAEGDDWARGYLDGWRAGLESSY